jgi:hypothetical protein
VRGLENIENAGPGVIIALNYVSFLEAALSAFVLTGLLLLILIMMILFGDAPWSLILFLFAQFVGFAGLLWYYDALMLKLARIMSI